MAEDDLPPDVGDPLHVAEVSRRKKGEAKLAAEFWRGVFADPVGRAELWKILKAAGAFEDRFDFGPSGVPNPQATWFLAGQKAFGFGLFQQWLLMEPQGALTMMLENDPRFPKPKK